MLLQFYYLVRSKADGNYLLAHLNTSIKPSESGYLLMFREHFDALSYLNTHGSDLAERFAVESVSSTQVGNLLKRWGFSGVGIVQDPLLPKIEFFSHI
jgi:hypothetical protein